MLQHIVLPAPTFVYCCQNDWRSFQNLIWKSSWQAESAQLHHHDRGASVSNDKPGDSHFGCDIKAIAIM